MSQKLLSPFLSDYTNSRGKIRLVKVRDCLNRGVISDDDLIELYKNWRDQSEYLILCYHRRDFRLEYRAIKCAKRGNDVYNWRISQKFKELEMLASLYGENKIFDINQAEPKTNCLLVTFTYDTKLKNKIDAWHDISLEYNRAITRLRQKFGKISVLRVWESFRNGYPHIHAILLFDDKRFNVFEHWTTNNKSTFRIQEKAEFSKVWHSNVDVLGVSSVRGAVGYLIKYLKKVHSGESKHSLTLANLWINHKQSFAMSGNFAERLANIRLDLRNLRNSKRPIIQTNLDGKKIKPTCVLVGIFSMDDIKKVNQVRNSKTWSFRIKKLPDKKPDLSDDLLHVACELYDANRGISLGSIVFSRSPKSEQEKTRRPTRIGVNWFDLPSKNRGKLDQQDKIWLNLLKNSKNKYGQVIA